MIEGKRYISSKQAAKITGYAKDYIGQLCREGRVPARLVGRSWYVLESAIQDHRFGNLEGGSEEKTSPERISAFGAHLDSPRYTPSTVEFLPSINQFKAASASEDDQSTSGNEIQDSWRAWFERIGQSEVLNTPVVASEIVPEPEMNEEIELVEETEAVNVPVRAIHHPPLYKPEEIEDLPKMTKDSFESGVVEEEPIQYESTKGSKRLIWSIQLAGVMFSAFAIVLAVMGTGYFDTYVLSNKQVSLLAGVSQFNR